MGVASILAPWQIYPVNVSQAELRPIVLEMHLSYKTENKVYITEAAVTMCVLTA